MRWRRRRLPCNRGRGQLRRLSLFVRAQAETPTSRPGIRRPCDGAPWGDAPNEIAAAPSDVVDGQRIVFVLGLEGCGADSAHARARDCDSAPIFAEVLGRVAGADEAIVGGVDAAGAACDGPALALGQAFGPWRLRHVFATADVQELVGRVVAFPVLVRDDALSGLPQQRGEDVCRLHAVAQEDGARTRDMWARHGRATHRREATLRVCRYDVAARCEDVDAGACRTVVCTRITLGSGANRDGVHVRRRVVRAGVWDVTIPKIPPSYHHCDAGSPRP
mmetsp:Transcript_70620/g.182100  ORF Transcript_70620/g.182100 Transcript_70620/m.182100 type:complete len:277 (-) Transcript_70620:308-1138(-)